jgi:hypothetical protein
VVVVSKSGEQRFFMSDLERELKRDRSTINSWSRSSWSPISKLWKVDPDDARQWRYLDEEGLEAVRSWMKTMNPGRSKPHKQYT